MYMKTMFIHNRKRVNSYHLQHITAPFQKRKHTQTSTIERIRTLPNVFQSKMSNSMDAKKITKIATRTSDKVFGLSA